MSGEFMTYETYLRQQVDKGCYGVAIISAEIALDIAEFIEKQRERIAEADRKTEPQTDLVKESPSLVKNLVKAFGEDGTWLERQGVYTLTLAEAKQRAVDIIESVLAKTEPQTERSSK